MSLFGLKLPVTKEDKDWTEESLLWLKELFKVSDVRSLKVITPTQDYFDWPFTGKESDAFKILEIVCRHMDVSLQNIELIFFNTPPPLEIADGIITTPVEMTDEGWITPVGMYYQDEDGKHIIEVELKELQDLNSLVSTLSHEVAHIKLIEAGIEENDEFLTDLTAIFFGFGIFIGNSIFSFTQWNTASSQGWSSKRKGYLPEQIVAYSMALLPQYSTISEYLYPFITKSILKYFKQSHNFIKKYPEKIQSI